MATAKKKKKGHTVKGALSPDILGGQDTVVPTRWQTQFEKLRKLRERISGSHGQALKNAQEEVASSVTTHPGDVATDEFDRDMNYTIANSEQHTIFEIDQALNRIANGTYGVCELTGKPIEKERLAAIPWARFSFEGEKNVERADQHQTVRLPALGRINPGAPSPHPAEES